MKANTWIVKPILLGVAISGLFLLIVHMARYERGAVAKIMHAPVPVPDGHKMRIPITHLDCTFTQHRTCQAQTKCWDNGGWNCNWDAPECLCGNELCECPPPLHLTPGIGARVVETVP